jgi:hypothetical protein
MKLIMSNPKSEEEYFKIFKSIISIAKSIDEKLEEKKKGLYFDAFYRSESNKDAQTPTAFFLHSFGIMGIGPEYISLEKIVHLKLLKFTSTVVSDFPKNNQIENMLKWRRAMLSYSIVNMNGKFKLRRKIGILKKDKKKLKDKLAEDKIDLFGESRNSTKKRLENVYSTLRAYELTARVVEIIIEEIKPLIDKHKKYVYEFMLLLGETWDIHDLLSEIHSGIVDYSSGFDSYYQDLKHSMDVYKRNRNKYKKLVDVSWSNKYPADIVKELKEIEEELSRGVDGDEIVYLKRDKETYEKLLREDEENESVSLFLRIEDNLNWYLIDANSSDMESFIGTQGSGRGTHCGSDSSSTVMFSLRSKNSLDQYVLHATVSAKEYIDQNNGRTIYEIIQTKGRRNQPVAPKYWSSIIRLFSDKLIGWQSDKDVHQEINNFDIEWLSEENLNHNTVDKSLKPLLLKLYKEFKKAKPLWSTPTKAKNFYGVGQIKEFIRYLENLNGVITVFDDDINIEYSNFYDLIENIKNIPRGKEWNDLYDTLIEFDDVSVPKIDLSEMEDFVKRIFEKHKAVYKKLLKFVKKSLEYHGLIFEHYTPKMIIFLIAKLIMNNDDEYVESVKEAIDEAFYTGFQVGTCSEKERAIRKYFKNYELVAEIGNDEERIFATISENDEDHTWNLAFHVPAIEDYLDEHGEVMVPIPEFRRNETRLEWDTCYDEESAFERFDEEIWQLQEMKKRGIS